jgi:hypothetical protein
MKSTIFVKGKRITSLSQLENILVDRDEWVYFKDRPKHPEVIRHMPFGVVQHAIEIGLLSEAVKR